MAVEMAIPDITMAVEPIMMPPAVDSTVGLPISLEPDEIISDVEDQIELDQWADLTRFGSIPVPKWYGSSHSTMGQIHLGYFRKDTEDMAGQELPVVTRSRDQRIALLSKKYASSTFSTEEEARLKILTEKLRNFVPKVTAKDMETLNAIAADIKEIGDLHAAIQQDIEPDD